MKKLTPLQYLAVLGIVLMGMVLYFKDYSGSSCDYCNDILEEAKASGVVYDAGTDAALEYEAQYRINATVTTDEKIRGFNIPREVACVMANLMTKDGGGYDGARVVYGYTAPTSPGRDLDYESLLFMVYPLRNDIDGMATRDVDVKLITVVKPTPGYALPCPDYCF